MGAFDVLTGSFHLISECLNCLNDAPWIQVTAEKMTTLTGWKPYQPITICTRLGTRTAYHGTSPALARSEPHTPQTAPGPGESRAAALPCWDGRTDGFDGGFTDLPEKTATGNGFWWRLSLVMWCRCCRLNLRMNPQWFWEVRWSWAFVGTLRVTFERARRLVCPVGCGDKIFETYLDEKVSLLIICCMVSKERGSYCKPLNSPRIQPFLAMRQLLWWEQPYRLWWNGWKLKAKRVCQGTPILPTRSDFYLLIST